MFGRRMFAIFMRSMNVRSTNIWVDEFTCQRIFVVPFILDPILRILNLQLQRQYCCRLQRFKKYKGENIFVFNMHKASCGIVNFYSAGVVTHDHRIGSSI
jgi:hypothetical protein